MISIIIPIYNAEKYIETCIQSVIDQTYADWEAVLVLDGATDRSGEICAKYREKDGRIRIVSKENGGVSSARNLGIRSASGDYIMFVDSDDWLEPDALESMVTKLQESGADACYCRKYYKNGKIVDTAIPVWKEKTMPAHIAAKRQLRNGFTPAPWLALTRLAKVKDVFFHEKIHVLEDWEYNFRQLVCLDSVTILDKPVYHYRTVVGSASKSSLNERKLTCLLIPEVINAYIEKENLPYKSEAEYVPVFLINHMLVILANGEYAKSPAKILCRFARKHLGYALTGKNIPLRQRIYTLMAAITPRLFCLAYNIKYRGNANG